MIDQFSRTKILIGEDNLNKLQQAHVAVFGLGGVGGSCVEALVRSGIGNITIIDNDKVSLTNINRQVIATHQSIGKDKTEVMKERILSINPLCNVNVLNMFVLPENLDRFDFTKYDYVVDCIDTITAKIAIICRCKALDIAIISSMGTGNKLNPTMLEIADISKTSVCPLAKVMRRELRNRNILHLKVVYSKEEPLVPLPNEEETNKRVTPGSMSFVPPVAGYILASEVIKDLIK